jgi:histidinol-phosphate phosphatase family domain/HAD-superfamily hydrolase, subfamily IIIA
MKKSNNRSAAIFLDRDDTIIKDAGYMSRPEQIELLPGAAETLRSAIASGIRLYLITNQSGIGRGYYTMSDAETCNARLLELLDLPAPGFSGICIAPEPPDVPSKYRKPSPAYLLEMLERDTLDPTRSFIIGDKISDLECGQNAGITPLLVGARPEALAFAEARGIQRFATLGEALVHACRR